MVKGLRLKLLALVLATSYATTQAVTLHNNTDQKVGIQWGSEENKLLLQQQFLAGAKITVPEEFGVIKLTYQKQPYILELKHDNEWYITEPSVENALLDINFRNGVLTISRSDR